MVNQKVKKNEHSRFIYKVRHESQKYAIMWNTKTQKKTKYYEIWTFINVKSQLRFIQNKYQLGDGGC